MNHHETIRKMKIMHLCEISFHLIHIWVHVKQSRRLLFLSWMVCHRGTNSRALPLKKLKVTIRNVFIHMVSHSSCVDIVMICEVYTSTTKNLLIHDVFRVTFSHIVTDTGLTDLVSKPGPIPMTKLVVSSQSAHLGYVLHQCFSFRHNLVQVRKK
jgi:hypothetical protein